MLFLHHTFPHYLSPFPLVFPLIFCKNTSRMNGNDLAAYLIIGAGIYWIGRRFLFGLLWAILIVFFHLAVHLLHKKLFD